MNCQECNTKIIEHQTSYTQRKGFYECPKCGKRVNT